MGRAERPACPNCGAVLTLLADNPTNDYYVVTSRRLGSPNRWSWEIRRKSKPMGIKMTEDGFQPDLAAQFAGNRALTDFLAELAKEEKRK
jgi:hypothetical protein